jgi:large subunit ribosomal protein L28
MAKCEVCDKGIQTGHRISITRSQVSRRANKIWRSNVKKVQVVEKNGAVRRAKVCTRCLRTARKEDNPVGITRSV